MRTKTEIAETEIYFEAEDKSYYKYDMKNL